MSNITKEQINKYAENLLFRLSEVESEELLNEFKEIDLHINQINKIANLKDYEPMSHPFDLPDIILREDVSDESLSLDEAFKNANKVNNREIEIPRVVN